MEFLIILDFHFVPIFLSIGVPDTTRFGIEGQSELVSRWANFTATATKNRGNSIISSFTLWTNFTATKKETTL